jgi:ribonucleoside-diphosphate reductase beta chain
MEQSQAYKPFSYPEFVQHAIDHEAMFWGEWEASLQRDVNQWKDGSITSRERDHITQILRLFTQSDVVVGGFYVDVFLPVFKNNEVRMSLLSIANRESTHMRAYALLNDTLGLPESEYAAFLEYEEMADKASFMEEYDVSTTRGVGLSLAKTIINEGVALFSAFAQLLNYQRPEAGSKMLGMCEIVEWSVKDETKHVEIAADLFRRFVEDHPEIVDDEFKKDIYTMFRIAIDLEDKFIDLSFADGGPKGLSKDDTKKYIRYIADRRLVQLGLKPNWQVETNPLGWIDHIVSGDTQKNFFEGRVTDYSHLGLSGDSWGWE